MPSHYILPLPYKSLAASIVLTIFFGPLGLLYSTFWGALVLSVLIIPGFFIPMDVSLLPLGMLWLTCIFLGAGLTSRYNKKLYRQCLSESVVSQ